MLDKFITLRQIYLCLSIYFVNDDCGLSLTAIKNFQQNVKPIKKTFNAGNEMA